MSLTRDLATIVACVGDTLEVVDERPGAMWVAQRVMELVGKWPTHRVVIDAAGPAGSVADRLHGLDVLTVTNTRQLQAASGMFYDAVMDHAVSRIPHASLDNAVRGAQRRQLGQAWGWSRQSGPPLIAATLAYWGSHQTIDTPIETSAIW